MPADAPPSRPAYDAIAHLYDVDMARNMPFDDVALYERLCRETPGPVLELGCGNGRILLELAARGLDVTGVDASTRMLAALVDKAAARALAWPRVCRMDARRLGFARGFAVVLCPYSLITYMTGENDAARLLDEVRRVTVDGGTVVVDAFVPRAGAGTARFRRDYVRVFGDGALMRFKRITPLSGGMNRIDRRYEVTDAAGRVTERIESSEDIRPLAPDDVLGLLEASGWRVSSTWWNYAASTPLADAQFFTAVASAR
ncbi:MAG: class I SAM-dependent methyltransferase [Casimicrobiaceae bacterium]